MNRVIVMFTDKTSPVCPDCNYAIEKDKRENNRGLKLGMIQELFTGRTRLV